MADINPISTFYMPSPYEQQMLEAKRRQQLADMMQQQASQSLIPQQGRVASKINPLAGLAQVLQSGMAGYNRRKADEAQLAANQADVQNAVSFMDRLQAGKPAEFSPDQALEASMRNAPTQGQTTPYMGQERTSYLQRGMLTGTPTTKALATALMGQKPEVQEYYDAVPITIGGKTQMVQYPKAGGAPRVMEGQKYEKPDKPTELPTEIREYQFAQNQGYKGSFEDWKLSQGRAKATNVNIPINTEKTYWGDIGAGLAKADLSTIDSARGAPQQIESARRIRAALAPDPVTGATPITGSGANIRLSLDKALATAGLIDPSRAIKTENLISELAKSTMASIKSSGLGSGQGFTDADRKFLEKAMSGNVEVNEKTLNYLADWQERAAIASINRGNAIMRRLRESKSAPQGLGLEDIQIPVAPAGAIRKRAQ